MAVGHSFGAGALTELSLCHPRLFTSLILLDPVIMDARPLGGGETALLSAVRRDAWPSRAVAVESFQRNKFYQTWDKRVFGNWVQYGLVSADPSQPEGPVVLSTLKELEVVTYIRPTVAAFDEEGKTLVRPDLVPEVSRWQDTSLASWPFYRPEPIVTYRKLSHVRPGVLYIVGGKSDLIDKETIAQRTLNTGSGHGGSGGTKNGRVKEVQVAHVGHLVPMEAPLETAQHTADWIKTELEHWRAEESEYEEWARQPERDRLGLSEQTKQKVGIKERPAKSKI